MAKCARCGAKVCPWKCKFYEKAGGWLCRDCEARYLIQEGEKER